MTDNRGFVLKILCKTGSSIRSQHFEKLQELYASADVMCLEHSYDLL